MARLTLSAVAVMVSVFSAAHASFVRHGGSDGSGSVQRQLGAQSGCNRPLDLVFLVDESGSIGNAAFQNARQTRVGITVFNTTAFTPVRLGSLSSYAALNTAISALPYDGGATNTPFGLQLALADFAVRARPASMAVPRVMIVVTDGGSNDCPIVGGTALCYPGCTTCNSTQGVQLWSNYARASGVTMFAMGVGPDINPTELNFIAGGEPRLQFLISNYSSILGSIVGAVGGAACLEPARMSPGTLVNTTVVGNSSIYIAYYNVSAPINIQVNVTYGPGVILCVSGRAVNPSTSSASAGGSLSDTGNDGCATPDPSGGGGSFVITGYPGPNRTVFLVAQGLGADNTTVTSFTIGTLPCSGISANVTAVLGGAGANLPPNASSYNISVGTSASISGGLAQCYTCPPSQVRLATTGALAGVCASRCATDHFWAWPYGQRTCQSCDSSCWQCAPAGGPRDCLTCYNGDALMLNALDPGAAGGTYAAGSGRCLSTDQCGTYGLVAQQQSAAAPGFLVCLPPTATPSAAAASVTSTLTVTASMTATATMSASTTATATMSASSTATGSAILPSSTSTATATTSSTSSGSSSPATLSVTPTYTVSATETALKSPTGTGSNSATATVTPSALKTATGTPTFSTTSSMTPSMTASASLTPSKTMTASMTASMTMTSSSTPSFTPSQSVTPSPSSTASVTGTLTGSSTSTGTRVSSTPMPLASGCLNDCYSHGTCRNVSASGNSSSVAVCTCDAGYLGPDCGGCDYGRYLQSSCAVNGTACGLPCLDTTSSSCVDYAVDARGMCPPGALPCEDSSGQFAAVLQCAVCPGTRVAPGGSIVPGSACTSHGVCSALGACACDSGWTGADCATQYSPPPPPDPCAGVTCNDRGVCTSGSCFCQLGWYGVNCTSNLDESSSPSPSSSATVTATATATGTSSASALVPTPLSSSSVAAVTESAHASSSPMASATMTPTMTATMTSSATGSGGIGAPVGRRVADDTMPRALAAYASEGTSSSSIASFVAPIDAPLDARFRYHAGPWSVCSAACGSDGVMTRIVTCHAVVPASLLRGTPFPGRASMDDKLTADAAAAGELASGRVADGSSAYADFALNKSASLPFLDAAGIAQGASGCVSTSAPPTIASCNRFSCDALAAAAAAASPTAASTSPADSFLPAAIIYFDFSDVLSDARLQPDSDARAAFLAAVRADAIAALTDATLSAQAPAAASALASAGISGNASLLLPPPLSADAAGRCLPADMVWVDPRGTGRVMMQLLAPSVIASVVTGGASRRLHAELPQRQLAFTPAAAALPAPAGSAAAAAVTLGLAVFGAPNATFRSTTATGSWLLRVHGVAVVAETANAMPGVGSPALPGTPARANYSAIGAGVGVAVAILLLLALVAVLLLLRKRRRQAADVARRQRKLQGAVASQRRVSSIAPVTRYGPYGGSSMHLKAAVSGDTDALSIRSSEGGAGRRVVILPHGSTTVGADGSFAVANPLGTAPVGGGGSTSTHAALLARDRASLSFARNAGSQHDGGDAYFSPPRPNRIAFEPAPAGGQTGQAAQHGFGMHAAAHPSPLMSRASSTRGLSRTSSTRSAVTVVNVMQVHVSPHHSAGAFMSSTSPTTVTAREGAAVLGARRRAPPSAVTSSVAVTRTAHAPPPASVGYTALTPMAAGPVHPFVLGSGENTGVTRSLQRHQHDVTSPTLSGVGLQHLSRPRTVSPATLQRVRVAPQAAGANALRRETP